MKKVFLGFALLLAAVFAHAEDVGITVKRAAITAALADSVTTKLVLHTGGFERNPLVTTSTTGLVALAALKWGVVEAVDASSFSPEHKEAAMAGLTAIWSVGTVNNLLVALSLPNPVAIAAGIATGIYLLNATYAEDTNSSAE